jgi:hypothetical protein
MSKVDYPDTKQEEPAYRVEGVDFDDNTSIPSFSALIEEGENRFNPTR